MSGLFLSGAGKKFFVPIIETALPEKGTLLELNFFPGSRQTVILKLSRLRLSGLGSVSNLAHANLGPSQP